MISGILGIQIVGIFFGLMMAYFSFLHMKRKEFSQGESIFWITAWTIFLAVTVFPRSLDFLAKDILNMSRTMDFLIILGFIFITGLMFHVYGIAKKNKKKIETVVSRTALNERSRK